MVRMQRFWEDLWKREGEFLSSGKPEYRHDTAFVGVATIAEQFYCEYKVENEFAFGEIPTEVKEKGTDLHDELIPQVAISRKRFAKLVQGKKPSFAVLRVWGKVGNLRILGMPDHIVWAEGKPLWVVELKTTGGDPTSLWDDQLAQIRIYGLLLQSMGFDCSRLKLALVRVRARDLSDEEKGALILKVSASLQAGAVKQLESQYDGSMKVHLVAHDGAAAEAAIASKRGYWLGEREPTSSTSVGKCRACEYNPVCPKTLYKPD
ncbi:MAG: PD-(D/E)XK nuclease family protein [Thaumarchaeota archaeon]|nr:PD-(D/E)XK nuclease family protein [Nitrososphaerota archaeon]